MALATRTYGNTGNPTWTTAAQLASSTANDGFGFATAVAPSAGDASYCAAVGTPQLGGGAGGCRLCGGVSLYRVNNATGAVTAGTPITFASAGVPSLPNNAMLGASVALYPVSGDTHLLLAGSPNTNEVHAFLVQACNTDAARPFEYLGAIDPFGSPSYVGLFGANLQVYVSGSTRMLFVAAPGNETDTNDQGGAVHVYRIAADFRTFTGVASLTSSDAFPGDGLGHYGLTFDGTRLFVGARYAGIGSRPIPSLSAINGGPYLVEGAVYVFTASVDLSTWAQEMAIHATAGPGTHYNRMGYT